MSKSLLIEKNDSCVPVAEYTYLAMYSFDQHIE